jgi:rifampicin phosphotransferase
MTTTTTLEWEPPGPGAWARESVHMAGTLSPMFVDLMWAPFTAGFKHTTARYGLPMSHVDMRMVNHYPYGRMRAVGAPEKATAPPPAAVLKVLARLHPEMRRRGRAAKAAFAHKTWRDDLAAWNDTVKPARVAASRALQDEDVEQLDDAGLSEHLRRAADNFRSGTGEHFGLMLADKIPVGDFLVAAAGWGLPNDEALALLAGSSPASGGPRPWLARIAKALEDAKTRPTSVADIRTAGSAAAEALDGYLEEFGWHLIGSFDFTGRCLIEMPDVIVTSVLAALDGVNASAEAETDEARAARARVPAGERALFDDLLGEARALYGMRDDNTGPTMAWPGGLVRRAALEAGRRLAAAGRIAAASHVFEATAADVAGMLSGATSPDPHELARRADDRAAAEADAPPDHLGPPDGPPPSPDVFPTAMARAMRAAMTYIGQSQTNFSVGNEATGVGTVSYRGTARVVTDAGDALARLEPGDVLVAPLTTPAYNAVLTIVGAVVIEEGGALCHAAIVARELGLPAVVGLRGATTSIPDGAKVEVDPVAATVTVL